IAVQMLFATMLVDADHATLEKTVVAFDGIGADGDAGLAVNVGVFLARVIDNVMLGELATKALIAASPIRHKMAFAPRGFSDDRDNLFLGCVFDMERASRSATLDEGQDSVLVAETALDIEAPLATDETLIDLDNPSATAQWAKLARPHRLTN